VWENLRLSERIALVGSGQFGLQLTHPLDCHVYLLDGGGEYALIDAGAGTAPERIVEQIELHRVTMDQIKFLLLTHVHGDHAAGAAYFHKAYGIPVVASEEAAPWLETADSEKTSIAPAIAAGVYPPDFHFPACPVARTVREGDTIAVGDIELAVLETPGHSRGHIGFWFVEGSKVTLFAGDSLFAGGKVVIQNIWDCSIPDYARTMEKIHSLRIDALFSGHGTFLLQKAHEHAKRACEAFRRLEIPPNL
jgi:glyoxylase-like metal-dependent hydrolase (beta-lactamase superfamily II)